MNQDFRCSLCDISLQTQVNFDTHVTGKKHRSMLHFTDTLPSQCETGVVVSGLPKSGPSQNELLAYLSTFGKVVKPHFPGNQRQFAWFEYEDVESCVRAKSLACHSFNGRKIFVRPWSLSQEATEPTPRESTHQPLEKPSTSRVDPALVPPDLSLSFDEQVAALMRELLPTHLVHKCIELCDELRQILKETFPRCQLFAFGSTITGLAFASSDVDVYLQSNFLYGNPKRINSMVYRQLKKFWSRFENMTIINGAKIPIVKLFHVGTQLFCDISSTNALGVRNSALIKLYLALDARVKPLVVLLKHWLKLCNLGGISNYALTMKALFYLQQLDQPVVPTVYRLQAVCREREFIDGWECSFDADPQNVRPSTNTLPLSALLAGFFEYYATFDYNTDVVCPLLGRTLPRSWFTETDLLPEGFSRYKEACAANRITTLQVEPVKLICVQDPFVLNHNITRGLTEKCANQLITCYKLFAEFFKKASPTAPSFLTDFLRESTVTGKKLVALASSETFVRIHPAEGPGLSFPDAGAWFTHTFRFLVEALEKVYKLNVRLVQDAEGDETAGKRARHDVGSVTFATLLPVTLLCEGFHDVMFCRNEAKKTVWAAPAGAVGSTGKLRSPIEIEEAISNLVIHNSDAKVKLKPILQFTCGFAPKVNPRCVELTFKNLSSEAKIFSAFINCVALALRKLIKESFTFLYSYNMAVELLKEKNK